MRALIFQPALVIHVIAGFFALLTGTIAISVRKKGGKLHNRAGIVFYWSMFVVFVTAVLFFVLYPAQLKYQFFLTIGIVSFYPTWSGKRILSMKKVVSPQWFDKLAAYIVGTSGLVMMGYGIYGFIPGNSFGGLEVLFTIFGIVSLLNAYGDLKIYLGYTEPERMHWFFTHAGKMGGAFSAAFIAFCVNVVPKYLPDGTPSYVFILTWVMPGVIIGVATARIIKSYRKKFGLVKA